MRYEGDIYRPPSEARSLILQATVGCSHNKCTFCLMYVKKKFRVRPMAEIMEDIEEASRVYPHTRRVFLADGDALAMETEQLATVLDCLDKRFPRLERVTVYGNPRDLLEKSVEELTMLRQRKLGMVYLGVESGSPEILQKVKKGATPAEMAEGARKTKAARLPLSVTVINGLAGLEGMEDHALETARLLNKMDPEYLGLLTLMVYPGTPFYRQIEAGALTMPGPAEVLGEILLMVKNLNLTDCVFRANHASNYLPIKAVLSREKDSLIASLNSIIHKQDKSAFRPEWMRGL